MNDVFKFVSDLRLKGFTYREIAVRLELSNMLTKTGGVKWTRQDVMDVMLQGESP